MKDKDKDRPGAKRGTGMYAQTNGQAQNSQTKKNPAPTYPAVGSLQTNGQVQNSQTKNPAAAYPMGSLPPAPLNAPGQQMNVPMHGAPQSQPMIPNGGKEA